MPCRRAEAATDEALEQAKEIFTFAPHRCLPKKAGNEVKGIVTKNC